jgi:hypothetical protein
MWQAILDAVRDWNTIGLIANLLTWCMLWYSERARQRNRKWMSSHETHLDKQEHRLRELLRSRITDGCFICARCGDILDDPTINTVVVKTPNGFILDLESQPFKKE